MTSQKTEMTQAFEQAGAMVAVKNRYVDKKQYGNYKSTLGDFMPPFAEFQKIKYNSDRSYNGNTYQDLKKILRDWKRWDKAEFPSDKSYDGHFTEHGHEFGSITKSQYLRKAQELLRMPIGGNFTGYETETRRVRYGIQNNYYALGNLKTGNITTFFIPNDIDSKTGKQMEKGWYYANEVKKDNPRK